VPRLARLLLLGRGMRTTALLLLAAAPALAFADPLTEPTVHDAAARLDAAQLAVYKKRALNLMLDSPVLLASSPRRPNAVQGDGWRIAHPAGASVHAEDVAEQLHRGHEVEAYEHSTGNTAFYVGLSMLGAAVIPGVIAGALAGTGDYGSRKAAEPLGATAGSAAATGLITMLIGHLASVYSDRQVPLDAATSLVADYNATIVDQLASPTVASKRDVASTASITARAPAVVAAAPVEKTETIVAASIRTPLGREHAPAITAPVLASAPAPEDDASPLGLVLLESEGVRVVRTAAPNSKLRPGDVILTVDEIPVFSLRVFDRYVSRSRPGDVLTVRVRRGGKKLDVTVRI